MFVLYQGNVNHFQEMPHIKRQRQAAIEALKINLSPRQKKLLSFCKLFVFHNETKVRHALLSSPSSFRCRKNRMQEESINIQAME